ncbi:MAG: metal dependent phosphohydrolase [Bryobacterales bacterium]|nr:metal dependent phosphohydrolase [Bryobacterales bacterium]
MVIMQPWSHNREMEPRQLANSICEKLRTSGHEALLVGGCVRDILLGRKPADYDIATDATPGEVMRLFPESVAVGAQFGVILVPRDGLKVEVATFRADAGYSDGRHPDAVVFARTPKEDVQRRDFTINGLLMRHDTGEVLDFVDGQADLRAGIIRAIGEPDRRFQEDKLRLLRAVRFAARFGFTIEPATFDALRRHAREIKQVSAERVRDELTKLLTEGAARRGFELLEETGLLREILPEIAAMKGVEQPPQFHPEGDVWIHTRLMIEHLPAGTSPTLAWGVLLHDVGKPATFKSAAETGDRIRFDGHVDVGVRMAQDVTRRLRFSNEDAEQIVALVDNHMRFKDVEQMRASTLKRFVRLPHFEEHLELHRLDCLSSHRRLESYGFVTRTLVETPPEQIRPARLLTGDDLLEMGYQPGPVFSEMLRAVEDAQLEGQLQTRDEAKEYVLRSFRRMKRQAVKR